MDEITINLDDAPLISQPSPVLIGQDSPVVVQENFVGGKSATIQIGSVETLPYGSEAYVRNVGTETDAIFNFGIPEGQQGEQGVAGDDGSDGVSATIQVGSVTTGLPDTNASVTNVGTSTNAVFDFIIPRGSRGEQGLTGEAGEDGVSPIAYVTQLSDGATIHIEDAQNTTDATVYNGTDGADGFSPIATVTQNTGSATISITDKNGTTTATVYDGSDAPAPNDGTLTIQKNGTTVQTFTANQSTNATANITVPTATSELTNDSGYITDFELVEMSYGESNAWAKFIAAYQGHKIVYCRASSNSNPATGSQTRKAFMAYVNNGDNPTSVEFQYYRSVSSHSDSQQGDQVFVYTLTNSNGGTWSVTTRNNFTKIVAGTNMTSSYSSGTLTLNATQPTVPTKTSDLTNDGSDGTSTYVEADDLATVATTGSYNDLTNKPTIPDPFDWSKFAGFKKPSNLTGQTYAGGYAATDVSGWNITIPSESGVYYYVEAMIPYASLGTTYRQLSLTYSNNSEFATYVEQRGASDSYGMRIAGICAGTGSSMLVKLRVILNGSGTTSGRIDGGFIRWEKLG